VENYIYFEMEHSVYCAPAFHEYSLISQLIIMRFSLNYGGEVFGIVNIFNYHWRAALKRVKGVDFAEKKIRELYRYRVLEQGRRQEGAGRGSCPPLEIQKK